MLTQKITLRLLLCANHMDTDYVPLKSSYTMKYQEEQAVHTTVLTIGHLMNVIRVQQVRAMKILCYPSHCNPSAIDFVVVISVTYTDGAHLIAKGYNDANCGWDGTDPMYHCVNNLYSRTTYKTGYFEDDIAVRCCSDSTGYSPDCSALAKNYNEAVAICASYGYRLCTYNEIADLVTKGTGCSFNCAYIWTSTQCSLQSTEIINAGKFTLS